jgi:hypothetical protein
MCLSDSAIGAEPPAVLGPRQGSHIISPASANTPAGAAADVGLQTINSLQTRTHVRVVPSGYDTYTYVGIVWK